MHKEAHKYIIITIMIVIMTKTLFSKDYYKDKFSQLTWGGGCRIHRLHLCKRGKTPHQ